MYREALEAAYDGVCTVYEMQPVFNPITKVTARQEEEVLTKEPCHLSFCKVGPSSGSESAAGVSQVIKLFLAPEREIRPGSKITVTQQGRTENYSRSGKAAVYASHQEITLELFRGYA